MRQREIAVIGVFILGMFTTTAQAQGAPRRQQIKRPAAQVSGAAQPMQYKGIFEPVNYTEDVDLKDVFFASTDEGWTSGEHGTILHTRNGGASWTPQLGGNPQSTEPLISRLRFVDSRHGWAVLKKDVGSNRQALLRTSDGEHWTQIGGIPFDYDLIDFQFSTPTNGVVIDGNGNGAMFWHTRDGGRTWKLAVPWDNCHAKVNINGLWQNAQCSFGRLQFISPRVGYAVGNVSNTNHTLFIAKTTDGGTTWSFWALQDPSVNGNPNNVTFLDENHGFAFVNSCCASQIFATADGARTWQPVLATADGTVRFADPEVAWGLATHRAAATLYYSVNGAQQWSSVSIQFPAEIADFSFPRRNRAYVVGEHGMVYRYRVVPKTYSAANAFDMPAMPGVNDAPLNARILRIRSDIVALQTKLNPQLLAAGLPPVNAMPSSTPLSDAADQTGRSLSAQDSSGSVADDAAAVGSVATTPVADAMPTAPTADVATSATSDVAAGNTTAVDASGGNAAITAGSSDFNQPASPAVQSCCANEVQQLQGDVSAFQQQVPAFSSKYRTLNLIVAGLRMAQDMIGKAEAFKSTLVAFKKAPNLQSAATVLQDFIAKYDGVRQEFAGGFQNPPPLPESDSGAAPGNAMAVAAAQGAGANGDPLAADSATAPVAPSDASAAAAQGGSQPQGKQSSQTSQTSDTVTQTADQAVQKAKDKVKKTLGGWLPH